MKSKDLLTLFSSLTLAYTVCLTPVYSQQVIIDGNTRTSLDVNRNVTSVYTSTIVNNKAFNSFKRFNINYGKIVNLHIPDNASQLINLVTSEQTNINGILNSIYQNQVGGNIFIVNPYGITIGSAGVVNTGSLTAITPADDFVRKFFLSPGNPDTNLVASLFDGTYELNKNANVTVDGTINAICDVKIDTGSIINRGAIYTGAFFKENDIDFGDVVNLNTLENAERIVSKKGNIMLLAQKDITNYGKIVSDGFSSINAGDIALKAEGNIVLNDGSLISAKGTNENSSGGTVYAYAMDTSVFNQAAVIDVRGGSISGDGGFIELSAAESVELIGGIFKAKASNGKNGSVLVDPPFLIFNTNQYTDGVDMNYHATTRIEINSGIFSSRDLNTVIGSDHSTAPSQGDSGDLTFTAPEINIGKNVNIYTFANNGFADGKLTIDATRRLGMEGGMLNAGNEQLTLNSGDVLNEGIQFTPESIKAGTLNSDFMTDKNQLNLVSQDTVTFGNSDSVLLGGNSLNFPGINIQSPQWNISGKISTPGDLNLTQTTINGKNYLGSENLDLNVGGDINLLARDKLTPQSSEIYIGNGVDANIQAKNINATATGEDSRVYVQQKTTLNVQNNVALESTGTNSSVSIGQDSKITTGNDFLLSCTGTGCAIQTGNNSEINIGGKGVLVANGTESGVGFGNSGRVNVTGDFSARAVKQVDLASSSVVAQGDATLKADNVSLGPGSNLEGTNLSIDAGKKLNIKGAKIKSSQETNIEIGDVLNNGIVFAPDEMNVKSLQCPGIQPGNRVVFNSNDGGVEIGNLDNVTVDGKPLNPSSVSARGLYAGLSGNITAEGLIYAQSKGDNQTTSVDANSKITSGGDVYLEAKGANSKVTVGPGAEVTAGDEVIIDAPDKQVSPAATVTSKKGSGTEGGDPWEAGGIVEGAGGTENNTENTSGNSGITTSGNSGSNSATQTEEDHEASQEVGSDLRNNDNVPDDGEKELIALLLHSGNDNSAEDGDDNLSGDDEYTIEFVTSGYQEFTEPGVNGLPGDDYTVPGKTISLTKFKSILNFNAGLSTEKPDIDLFNEDDRFLIVYTFGVGIIGGDMGIPSDERIYVSEFIDEMKYYVNLFLTKMGYENSSIKEAVVDMMVNEFVINQMHNSDVY